MSEADENVMSDEDLEAAYRDMAMALHHQDGHVEIDSNAEVSLSDDRGAYVQAWVWVGDDEFDSDTRKKVDAAREGHCLSAGSEDTDD